MPIQSGRFVASEAAGLFGIPYSRFGDKRPITLVSLLGDLISGASRAWVESSIGVSTASLIRGFF